MATASDVLDPALLVLKEAWPAPLWEQRLADARARLAVIEAVEAAKAAGKSEVQALAAAGGGLSRSSYRGRLGRFQTQGFVGLFNKRPPPPPEELKVTPTARALICGMRLADANIEVEKIAEVLAARLGITSSPTVIKRVLAEEGLNRKRGTGRFMPADPAKQTTVDWLFAGAEFLRLADEELGLGAAFTEVITTTAREVASKTTPPAEPAPATGRGERGHFTAESNAANAKNGAELGPAFRSVEAKRAETDLGARRLAKEGEATVAGKVTALLAMPYLTDTGKAIQLDTFRAQTGIVEACGTSYASSTMDRFLRDMKYLKLGQPLVEAHAAFWSMHEPAADTKAAALCVYMDGSNKGLWTDKFSKAGKVSSSGRVMPCIEQALVHTGMGTPIYWHAFSGHESLVKHAVPLLDKLEAMLGPDWQAGRILVIDGEGAALDLLRTLDDADRQFITILREGQVSGPEAVRDLTTWEPFRENDEIAEGRFTLGANTKTPFDVRVVLLRRVRAGQLTVLATNVEPETFDAKEVACSYFDRWPKQEHRFRNFSQGAHFKRIHGYGKQLVTNVTVVTKLDKLAIQGERLAKQGEAVGEALKAAVKARHKAKRGLNMAKARRKLNDNRVAFELSAKRPDPKALTTRVQGGQTERDRFAAAEEKLDLALEEVAKLEEKRDAIAKKATEVAQRAEVLESRRTIYQSDTELDTIMTAFKLGFGLLVEAVLRMYFGGLRMSIDHFARHVLTAPGTRISDATTVTIRFKPSPNKEIQAALLAACAHVTALERRRDGKLLRMEVEDPPDRKQRSKPAS